MYDGVAVVPELRDWILAAVADPSSPVEPADVAQGVRYVWDQMDQWRDRASVPARPPPRRPLAFRVTYVSHENVPDARANHDAEVLQHPAVHWAPRRPRMSFDGSRVVAPN